VAAKVVEEHVELSAQARRVLDALLKAYPSTMSLYALRRATEFTRAAISAALGELLELKLVENHAGVFRAGAGLFEAAS
jgi:DNA-binding IclR family transcriptional regulator